MGVFRPGFLSANMRNDSGLTLWLSTQRLPAISKSESRSISFRCHDLPTIPERVETSIITMTNRRNALTVFGLMFMRSAISLLIKPSLPTSVWLES